MEKKLGTEPAFAQSSTELYYAAIGQDQMTSGMSKRFYAACSAMQGILSASKTLSIENGLAVNEVRLAYAIADELLKQENEKESE